MLEAHVQFELQCWAPDRAEETLSTELYALIAWLDQIPLGDLIDGQTVVSSIQELVLSRPIGPELQQEILATVVAGQQAAAAETATIGEILPEAEFDEIARAAVGMRDLQEAVITQITSSEVYAKLISHVLYEGLKGYLTEENPVSKRVPGASSIMKLGQSAIGNAAPGLSQGIDKQLMGFVNSNISDAMRDSREYLVDALTEERLMETAGEIYHEAAEAELGEAAAQLSPEALKEILMAMFGAWEHLRTTDTVSRLVEVPIVDFFERWGNEPVGKVLIAAGIDADDLVSTISLAAATVIERAYQDGYLEERIRARLAPFYEHMAQQ